MKELDVIQMENIYGGLDMACAVGIGLYCIRLGGMFGGLYGMAAGAIVGGIIGAAGC